MTAKKPDGATMSNDSLLAVTIDGEERSLTVTDLIGELNYASYRSHRERLTDWSAERVQVMFVRVGTGNLVDVQEWEARYQAEQLSEVRLAG